MLEASVPTTVEASTTDRGIRDPMSATRFPFDDTQDSLSQKRLGR
jgi:hypothetical protein